MRSSQLAFSRLVPDRDPVRFRQSFPALFGYRVGSLILGRSPSVSFASGPGIVPLGAEPGGGCHLLIEAWELRRKLRDRLYGRLELLLGSGREAALNRFALFPADSGMRSVDHVPRPRHHNRADLPQGSLNRPLESDQNVQRNGGEGDDDLQELFHGYFSCGFAMLLLALCMGG